MEKLLMLQSKIFSILFGLLAIGELCAFIDGKIWCLGAFIILAILSIVLYLDYKKNKADGKL